MDMESYIDVARHSAALKEFVDELNDKYEKVESMLEESRRDPETEPYKSKYAAKKILMEMKSTLEGLLADVWPTHSLVDVLEGMLGYVWLTLGTISVDTEEFTVGEEYLSNCIKVLEANALRPTSILIILSAMNQLGILWSHRGDYEKSHCYLEQAENLYTDYIDQVVATPVEICKLFNCTKDTPEPQTKFGKPIEKIHTLTLYYLAQIYGTLGFPIKSAQYCHTTLKRQLEGKDVDPIEWALNSATLAQFFMEKSAFRLARHHLAAASYVLEQHEATLNAEVTEGDENGMMERFNHRSADVARCWAKYGIVLLSASKDRLMSSDDDYDTTPNVTPAKTNPVLPEFSGLQFSTLELASYEEQVTANHILMYDDAKLVYLNSQQWLAKAKEYYSLDSHASDYVQIIQDWSQLLRNLAFFEDDGAKQCKLHKKRINLLEEVVAELNPNYYLCACRELWFELGETYSTILDVKVQRMQDSPERPTPHVLKKINLLANKAIGAYSSFLDLLKDVKTKEMPAQFPAEMEHAALIAYFYLGRLYSKLILPDKAVQLEYTKKSYENYKVVVDYCERNEKAKQHIGTELGVCQEMVKLLPVKILKIGSVI